MHDRKRITTKAIRPHEEDSTTRRKEKGDFTVESRIARYRKALLVPHSHLHIQRRKRGREKKSKQKQMETPSLLVQQLGFSD